MEKSKVYFCDLYSDSNKNNLFNRLKQLFDISGFNEFIEEKSLVAIKLHFGEKGNFTYMHPVAVRQIVDKVKEYGGKPFLTDTNTLYTGSRMNSVDHITSAIENGFAYSVVNAPIIIADGIYGRNSAEVKIDKKHFESVKIAGDVYNASSLIVLSHFKGHGGAGFGGALKNLAMGCATPAGKQMQHSDVKPQVREERCIGCGPKRAIKVQWKTDGTAFLEKMAEHAYGAVKDKQGKTGYISFLMNVTPLCDCVGFSGKPLSQDIGIFSSTDPVALDKACYDAVCNAMGHDVFKHAHPDVESTLILDYAEEIGLGNKDYELIKL